MSGAPRDGDARVNRRFTPRGGASGSGAPHALTRRTDDIESLSIPKSSTKL
jgi:hypothetical protein